VLVVGLMSGTSADGVDAALVDWPDQATHARPFELVAFQETEFPRELQGRIHRLAADEPGSGGVVRELAALDVELAERFAVAVHRLLAHAGLSAGQIAGIASHGQTVGHFPEVGASLQIGNPSVLAERTGITTVADFRPRDMAAGGEGAPLAPFFHHAVMSDPGECRAALNLGGIANVTWLPDSGAPDEVVAFDIGPANALVDGVVQIQSEGRERMDRDGAMALRGRVDVALLETLLDDDYLRRPPPKSTGRERYGAREARDLVAAWREREGRPEDLVATLVAFTAQATANACRDFLPHGAKRLARLLVGGGGAANPAVMSALAGALPGVSVEPFDAVGVPSGAAEAMAFSLMGRNALLGAPNHLPSCTGAHGARVLGQIVPGAAVRA